MGTKTRPWIFFEDHICTSGTKQGIISVGAIGQTNAEKLVLILFLNALSTDGWTSRKPLTQSPKLVTNNWIFCIDQFDINLRFRDSLNEYVLEEAKKAQKDAAEKREKDKQASLFQAMKDWEAKHGDISQFDASKVDVMSIHEQAALNVSSAESKYHKM
jgi:Holliday junction resolvase-like predicted endonuclease